MVSGCCMISFTVDCARHAESQELFVQLDDLHLLISTSHDHSLTLQIQITDILDHEPNL